MRRSSSGTCARGSSAATNARPRDETRSPANRHNYNAVVAGGVFGKVFNENIPEGSLERLTGQIEKEQEAITCTDIVMPLVEFLKTGKYRSRQVERSGDCPDLPELAC